MSTITAANSILLISVGGIFPVPQQIQGYASDDGFTFEAIDPAEIVMGVDGHMSAGYVPVPKIQTINIMPDSPSLSMFETWLAAMDTAREIFFANGSVVLTAIGRKYTMTRGVLTSVQPIAGVKKTLQPMPYKITWESVTPSPI